MTEIERLNQRIDRLEKTLLDANSWLKTGEGIDLLYHSDYADSTEESSASLLKKLLNKEGSMKPKIIITVEGGLVQSVNANCPINCLVVDLDTDGADKEDLVDLYEDGDPALVCNFPAEVNPHRVPELFDVFERLFK